MTQRYLTFLAAVLVALATSAFSLRSSLPPTMAFIIDDAGVTGGYYERLAMLPAPLTVAVIPDVDRTDWFLSVARAHTNWDVLAHIPMQPMQKATCVVGVNTNMSDQEVADYLNGCLDRLGPVAGINNHQGSLISRDRRILDVIMGVLRQRGMFMVDSRTNLRSLIPGVAREQGVLCLSNDGFLDVDPTPEKIRAKLAKLYSTARWRGHVVAIGHIQHSATLDCLAEFMRAHAADVRFVGIRTLIAEHR